MILRVRKYIMCKYLIEDIINLPPDPSRGVKMRGEILLSSTLAVSVYEVSSMTDVT